MAAQALSDVRQLVKGGGAGRDDHRPIKRYGAVKQGTIDGVRRGDFHCVHVQHFKCPDILQAERHDDEAQTVPLYLGPHGAHVVDPQLETVQHRKHIGLVRFLVVG